MAFPSKLSGEYDSRDTSDLIRSLADGGLGLVISGAEEHGYGTLVSFAEAASPDNLTVMQRFGSGIVTVSLLPERIYDLDLPMMMGATALPGRGAFTVSVDAASGTTTGISAADRSRTIRTLIDPTSRPTDLTRPGHVYPVRHRVNSGYPADIALELAVIARSYPSGVATALLNDDGSLASPADTLAFAQAREFCLVDFRVDGGSPVTEVDSHDRNDDVSVH